MVTNTSLLDSKIKESGLKITYIAEKMGISRDTFYKKKSALRAFNQYEIDKLCNILNITSLKEKESIFFSH